MEKSVDFDNLREITGGDAELEIELFRNFLSSSNDCIQKLHAVLGADDESGWRKQAHAFKGICLNLGAKPLAELCKKAQDDFRAVPEDKKSMLAAIETEFTRVRAAVEGVYPNL